MDGMIVEGRDYRFTMFHDHKSSLVAERAAFPVKMLQEGLFACMRRSRN